MSIKTECMIRLDDITPDMNWDNFNRVKDIFHKYQIVPLIGVVPDNKDELLHKEEECPEFWDTIRVLQDKGWKIAQHGTTHCYETQDTGILGINPFSEFAGLSYEEQLEKLQAGKRILEENGIHTDIFMAPGHTYDKNTLKALRECGFTTLTDGLFPKPYYEAGILCIPCRLRWLKISSGVDTICLHTNVMDDADMADLEAFCKKYQEFIVPFQPERYRNIAKEKTFYLRLYERMMLAERNLKDKVVHSGRLAWYFEKTSHSSSKVKWLKRVLFLPLLVCYRGKE